MLPGADLDSFVMLSDILPTGGSALNSSKRSTHKRTGLEVGVLCGKIQPGMVHRFPESLLSAMSFGATYSLNNSDGSAVRKVMELTHGNGVDVVLECIGTPTGWDI